MTLCIAWKTNSGMCFASDSRLSNSQGIITDSASKVFKINLKIKSPTNREDNTESNLYQSNFGLCFAGSYLNGSLMADAISLLFSNIQGAPNYSDFSIENLSNIAFNVYKKVSSQLMVTNNRDGLSQSLFGGFCPASKVFKLYKFNYTIKQTVEFSKEELNITNTPIFLGDTNAKNRATQLLGNINAVYGYYHLLRDIIKDPNISTVGGDIQTGVFENDNFEIFGILDYYIDESIQYPQVKSTFRFRGLEIDFDEEDLRSGYINPAITFMNPFEKDREAYFNEINRRINEGEYGPI